MEGKARLRLLGIAVILLCAFGIYKSLNASVVTINGGTHEFDGLFDYPLWGLAHFIPAAVFMVLMPFQLWAGFRNRHRKLHRRSGRVLFAAGLILATTGIVFPYMLPGRPISEKIFMTTFSVVFGIFLIKAVLTASRRDIVNHRKWMVLAVGGALGPMVQRIIFPVFPLTLGIHSLPEFWNYFVTSLWLATGISLGSAALWLRLTRTQSDIEGGNEIMSPASAGNLAVSSKIIGS